MGIRIRGFRGLTLLCVDWTSITDEGVEELRRALPATTISAEHRRLPAESAAATTQE
jgi:hypothetical protein